MTSSLAAQPAAMATAAAWCAGAYLVGSLPTGLILARRRGIDLRAVGSGNIGATNVARALGRRWAVLVLIVDAAKGFGPVAAAARFAPAGFSASIAADERPAVVACVGLAAIVGHMFTIFLRGRGGKGVATSLGVAAGLSPALALGCLAAYAVVYGSTRLSSLGSIVGMWVFPVLALLLPQIHLPVAYSMLSIVTALLVTWRHRTNIRGLLRGDERRA